METVLIADDEVNIREGLKIIIDWNELGFEICGEAANGEEALSAILEKNPSLVLLDIRMPKMYGTDLIRIARERGYKGRFIILSAIRFTSKPIDEDELSQAITKIKQGLEKEHAASQNIELLKNKAKDVILHEIVTGTYNTAEAALLSPRKMEEMNLYADIYQVVIYEKFSENPEDISYSFADLLKITNKGNHTFEYFEEDGNEVILLKGQFALDKFSGFLERYEKNPPQKGSPLDTLFLAYGRPVRSLDEIYLSYEEAYTLQKRRFFCMQGQHTLGYDALPKVQDITLEINNDKLEEYSNLLTDYLIAFQRNKVAETLFSLEEFLYNVKNDIASVKLFLTDLYLRIKEKANHIFCSAKSLFLPTPRLFDRIEAAIMKLSFYFRTDGNDHHECHRKSFP